MDTEEEEEEEEGLESSSSELSSSLVLEAEEAAGFRRVWDRVFESAIAARCDASRVTRRAALILLVVTIVFCSGTGGVDAMKGGKSQNGAEEKEVLGQVTSTSSAGRNRCSAVE